jgi:hypothetical protein
MGVRQVGFDRMMDGSNFGLKPRGAGLITGTLQALEGAQGPTNVVALGASKANLGALDAAELLNATMVGFDGPGILGTAQRGEFIHRKVVGGPVFTAAVLGSELEDLDQTIAFQMDERAGGAELDLREGFKPLTLWIDLTVALELRQPDLV